MDNPGLPKALWSQIDGRLWHATACEGLHGIINDREIRAAVGNRYVGSFCRNQGYVSLFDFGPASDDNSSQFNNWSRWLGHEQGTSVAVWLEIDRARVHERLMDPKATREALKQLMDQRRAEDKLHEPGITVIPGVEACHKGPIPLAATADILLIYQHDRELFRRIGKPNIDTVQQVDAFEASLPPHK